MNRIFSGLQINMVHRRIEAIRQGRLWEIGEWNIYQFPRDGGFDLEVWYLPKNWLCLPRISSDTRVNIVPSYPFRDYVRVPVRDVPHEFLFDQARALAEWQRDFLYE